MGAAVWAAAGHIAPADAASASERIAAPAAWWVFLSAALAAFAVPRWRHRPASTLPALLSTMPWWPLPLPAVALIWTGPLAWLPILAVMFAAAAPLLARAGQRLAALSPTRAVVVVGAASIVISTAVAWSIAPRLPGGDEPHYLVITQSLLADGDLRIENNHARRDYASYFGGTLRPDVIQRGRDGEIYSIHAPGTSVLVLPAFAAFGYRGAQATVALAAAAALMIVWFTAWRLTRNRAAAWFAAAVVLATPTFLLQSVTVFPDGPGMLATAAGMWLIVRLATDGEARVVRAWQIVAVSAALSALPWLHTRFAVLAVGLGLAIFTLLARRVPAGASRFRGPAVFSVVPIASAIGWLSYFQIIYGTPNPAAPYGTDGSLTSLAFVPGGLLGLLFDQQFGLVAYAPAVGVAAAALWSVSRGGSRRTVVWTGLAVAIGYLGVATTYWMWWAGVPAPPARLAAATLPLLGGGLAAFWDRASSRARAVFLTLLAVSAAVATLTVAVDRGALAFNPRDAIARWLDWLGPVVNLPRAWPSFFWRLDPANLATEWPFAAHVGMWLAVPVSGAALLTHAAHRYAWTPERMRTGLAWGMCFVVMLTASVGWAWNGSTGLDPARAQVDVLDRHAAGGPLVRISPWTVARGGDAWRAMVIASEDAGRTEGPRPWLVLRGVPPGDYAVDVAMEQPAAGELAAAIGRSGGRERTWALEAVRVQTLPLQLPAGAERLTLAAEPSLGAAAGRVALRPVTLPAGGRVSARASARFGNLTVYFLDEAVFVEREGFWVRGAQTAAFVITPGDESRRVVELLLRNGATANQVHLEAGTLRLDVDLAAGEERIVMVPVEAARGVRLTIGSRSGFRPSETDGSADQRYLGVWGEVR